MLFFLLVLLSLIVGSVAFGWNRLKVSVKADPPQMVTVRKDTFIHEILERGSVDSAKNIEIRCQVESAGGLTIISVVPEGTIVKQGDLLVELDSSTLRENVTKQQITVLASQSKFAESEAELKTAKLTYKEYLEGKLKEEEKTIENEIFTAQEDVRTKEDNLSYYKRLLERGYVTDSKVEADLIDLEKAQNALALAEIKLSVLRNITKEKNVVQYEADIAKANAKVESDKKSLELDQTRLEHLETQLDLCRILAPQDGQVIYYLPRWGGDEDLIKEGKKVVERQILLRLPDPSQMQVRGLVNEANIRLVKVGQKATIRLEAFPNQVFNGIVRIVNDYPEPGNWMGGSMSKEYMTTVMILDPPEGIKPGLTAEARILVNEIQAALVLPVQAIFSYGGKAYALTYKEGKWDKVEVQSGPTNDKEVVILSGLSEGDEVVLGAWAHRDKVDLPKLRSEDGNEDGKGSDHVQEEQAGTPSERQPEKQTEKPSTESSVKASTSQPGKGAQEEPSVPDRDSLNSEDRKDKENREQTPEHSKV